MLTLGVVTDLHFGPSALHEGKLRKLSERAPELLRRFQREMSRLGPNLVVNLGDVVEDESPTLDSSRYAQAAELLAGAVARVVHVAGNHDRIHLGAAELRTAWGLEPEGPLYRSFDERGYHVVVLCTHERKDCDVRIDEAQLEWLARDLERNRLPAVILMHHSAAEQDLVGNRWFSQSPELCLVEERRRLRDLLCEHGHTVLVLNGHLHWNHIFVDRGIPYVTLQSLTENVEEDAPGTPAAAWAWVQLSPDAVRIRVAGAEPARYELCR